MTYTDFVSKFPDGRKTSKGWICKCPAHEDSTASLHICPSSTGGVLLKCFAGCSLEQITGALGLKVKDLFPDSEKTSFKVPDKGFKPSQPEVKPEIEHVYTYQNHNCDDVYEVVRMKPKSFRQRHTVNGNWVWNMDGVERFLYRLPNVLKAPIVWLCEGEKDADNLNLLGFCATCNVGGAGKWLDGYTESLAGKDVVLCGDNDEPGKKHMEMVFDSICGKVKSVRKLTLPQTVKDASDYIATFKTPEEAKEALQVLFSDAHPFYKGVKLPLYSMSELEDAYARHAMAMKTDSFSLGKWMPTLGRVIRPLVPGELVFIIGNTGVGKTGVMAELAHCSRPMPTIMFELELPDVLMFERSVASVVGMTCQQVETAYTSGERLGPILEKKFKGLYLCTESRLTLADIENYIVRSELKMGEKPKLVLIDYMQLLSGGGSDRYERFSSIAEGLKVLAKSTKTIIIVSSQVKRPSDGNRNLSLFSAKETGSIENSCGVLLGIWRDEKDPSLMHIQVFKSTKGGGGAEVLCNFDGQKMKITERSQFTQADVP